MHENKFGVVSRYKAPPRPLKDSLARGQLHSSAGWPRRGDFAQQYWSPVDKEYVDHLLVCHGPSWLPCFTLPLALILLLWTPLTSFRATVSPTMAVRTPLLVDTGHLFVPSFQLSDPIQYMTGSGRWP